MAEVERWKEEWKAGKISEEDAFRESLYLIGKVSEEGRKFARRKRICRQLNIPFKDNVDDHYFDEEEAALLNLKRIEHILSFADDSDDEKEDEEARGKTDTEIESESESEDDEPQSDEEDESDTDH